jgi:hypothetical protein
MWMSWYKHAKFAEGGGEGKVCHPLNFGYQQYRHFQYYCNVQLQSWFSYEMQLYRNTVIKCHTT